MLNWLLSRPLQIKFFVCTILLVCAFLLMLMLNVLQAIDSFLSQHIEQDMQDRTHVLAMALMEGTTVRNPGVMRNLLHDVSKMHGYCYLGVQDNTGKTLASTESPRNSSGLATDGSSNRCVDGSIPLIHDSKPFGTLHYSVDMSSVDALKSSLRTKLLVVSLLWLTIGATVYFLLVRRLVKPLQAITLASESMAHGNFSTAMPAELPQDELGKLATSFSNMALALRERVESQQRYAHALYSEKARLNALISILPVGVIFVDPDRRVQLINQECSRLWKLHENEDYIGQLDTVLIEHARHFIEKPDEFVQYIEKEIREYGISPPFDTRLINHTVIRSRSRVVPDASEERYIGRMWMFEDVSEEYMRLQDIQARAENDVLTGLYNRRRFEEDVERLFAQAQRNSRRLSLLYFDLDDFKHINDVYGHAAGDAIIKGIAQLLSLQSRRNEELYRLDSDEFAILVADAEQHQIEALARRVITTVEKLLFSFDGQEVHVSCSMGIATCSPKNIQDSAADLMQQADIAMYQAKHAGKNRWHFYDPDQPLDLDRNSR